MQSNRWLQTLIALLTIIAALFLAGQVWSFFMQFSSIILLFFLSWLLAFVLRPIAKWLTGKGVPYTFSVLAVYLVLAMLFVLGGFLLIPVITQQIEQLQKNFNSYVNALAGFVDAGQKILISWGVRDVDINKFYTDLASQAQTIGMGVLNNAFSILQSVATLMLQLILVLLLSFYFMKDGERLFGGILKLLPPRWQDEVRLIAISLEKSFGAFVRGQLVFALVYAVLTAAVMMVFKLEYVVIASVVAGLCMIIPLIGNFLAFVPPMLVCLVIRPQDWWLVLLWLFIAQSFMMNFVGPRIMSQAIGIHPLYVVAAMLIGGQVAGFWGALFGIPLAGAVNLMGRPLMRRMRHQLPAYNEAPSGQLSTGAFVTGPLRAEIVASADAARARAAAEQKARLAESELLPGALGPMPDGAQPMPVVAGAADFDPDFELQPTEPYRLTLSGRAWRFAWVFIARAYAWVGTRARIGSSRR
jgi:predicted PurR-regulated permease PerM